MATNRRDRAFHLVISAVALLLATVSGATIWRWHTESHPVTSAAGRMLVAQPNLKMRSPYLTETSNRMPLAATTTTNTFGSSPIVHSASWVHSVVRRASTSNVTIQQGGTTLHVIGVGADTSIVEVNKVASLIRKYQILRQDLSVLQLGEDTPLFVYVAHSVSDYEQKLSTLGLSTRDVKSLGQDTGGFTQGANVLIPMFQNTNLPDLGNTIGHELTHAILNTTVGQLPSWMNEGLAVYDGMHVQAQIEGSVSYEGYATQMAESLLDAANQKQLIPLAVDESQVLHSTATYDLELQDWLAVSSLIEKDGLAPLGQYLKRLQFGEAESTAFNRSFHTSLYIMNQQVFKMFNTAARSQDKGFSVSIQIPNGFTGSIKVLQHGSRVWHSLQVKPGFVSIKVSRTGDILTHDDNVTSLRNSSTPDPETAYIDITSTKPFRYNGQQVRNCGFALDYHYGLYSFINSWIETSDGNSQYLSSPSLFGVKLVNVADANVSDPLVPLLTVE